MTETWCFDGIWTQKVRLTTYIWIRGFFSIPKKCAYKLKSVLLFFILERKAATTRWTFIQMWSHLPFQGSSNCLQWVKWKSHSKISPMWVIHLIFFIILFFLFIQKEGSPMGNYLFLYNIYRVRSQRYLSFVSKESQ